MCVYVEGWGSSVFEHAIAVCAHMCLQGSRHTHICAAQCINLPT